MAKCECDYQEGEKIEMGGKKFYIQGLEVMDLSEGEEKLTDVKKDCFIKELVQEGVEDERCVINRGYGPAAGHCWKCGMFTWVYLKRIG